MKVIKEKKIEGCLEGTYIYELLLDNPLTKTFIQYLGALGKFIYQDTLEKPFFKVIVRGEMTIKGSQGAKSFRIVFGSPEVREELNKLIYYIEKYTDES
jgi:hypothetical protein